MTKNNKKWFENSKKNLIKGVKWIGNKSWEGITYAWDNKDDWIAKAEDADSERRKEFQKKEDRVEKLINNQSQEQKKAKTKEIFRKYKNNETLSMEEKMYFQKIKDQGKKTR